MYIVHPLRCKIMHWAVQPGMTYDPKRSWRHHEPF